MLEPVQSLKALERTHRHLDLKFRNYRLTKTGRQKTHPRLSLALAKRSAKTMNAVNMYSRIALARYAIKLLEAHFEKHEIADSFFVTVALEEHAMPIEEARFYDARIHAKWIREVFGNVHYFGLLEIAHYYDGAPFRPGAKQEPWVSWHAHLVVWGMSQKKLGSLAKIVNDRHRAFIPGRPAFHYYKIETSGTQRVIPYICKIPMRESCSYLKRKKRDPAVDGQVSITVPKRQQLKRDIRMGHLAECLAAIGVDRHLADLCVAGGEGVALRNRVLRQAQEYVVRAEEKWNRRLWETCIGSSLGE